MKNLLYLLAIVCMSVSSQNKYLTKTGILTFEASVPSFEEVAAQNNSTTAILNTETGEFAALVLVKGFRFKNALMEEHFNENYAESDQYPKATFKGGIDGFNMDRLEATYKINGELTFHGISKAIENIPLTISIQEGNITLSGNFVTYASDFDIDIPKIVSKKVAEEIGVTFVFILHKK